MEIMNDIKKTRASIKACKVSMGMVLVNASLYAGTLYALKTHPSNVMYAVSGGTLVLGTGSIVFFKKRLSRSLKRYDNMRTISDLNKLMLSTSAEFRRMAYMIEDVDSRIAIIDKLDELTEEFINKSHKHMKIMRLNSNSFDDEMSAYKQEYVTTLSEYYNLFDAKIITR